MDRIASIVLRYLILMALSLGNFWLIYSLFTFPTMGASYLIIKMVYSDAIIEGNAIIYSGHMLVLISSCVGGAAYFLLLLLNLSTSMPIKKRITSILFLLISLFTINVIRIVAFGLLFASDYAHIETLHSIVWHFTSIFIGVALWFANVFLFKIKNIPVYSDLCYIRSLIK